GVYVVEDFRQLALEAREVGSSAGKLGKGIHLVVGLQPVSALNPASVAMGVQPYPQCATYADGVNRNVLGRLDLLDDLIEVNLAKGISPAGYQNDVLLSFDPLDPVQCVIERVEQIPLRESGYAHHVQRTHDCALILGEIHQNLRLHII